MNVNKRILFVTIVTISFILLWIYSCRHNPIIPSDISDICFDSQVLPIFQNNCAKSGCHDGSEGSRMSFNSYVNISNGVVAGNPDRSSLYQSIIGKSGEGLMPPDQPLSLENRTIIRLWIEQGARETLCTDTTGTPSNYNARACFSRDILPVLVSSCTASGCHDAATHRSGFNFTTYSSTLNSVTAGSPSRSTLYQVITTTSGEERMPPSPYSRLTQAQIDSIAAWIRYGALNETCGELCDTVNTITFSGVIWPTIQSTCTGCHSGGSLSGNIDLSSYANVQTIAANGMLMNALKGNGVTKMPPSGSLTACRIRQFQIWVNNGYKNN